MIKKGLMALSMVVCFGLATMFSVNSSEAQNHLTQHSNEYNCYSASSGNPAGAWFYDCKSCNKVDGMHSGESNVCQD